MQKLLSSTFSSWLSKLRKIVQNERSQAGYKETEKWRKLLAKKLLEEDIRAGVFPIDKPIDGDWEMVYFQRPEYAKFDHQKFAEQLQLIRVQEKKASTHASEDKHAFDRFCLFHPVSLFSHYGYKQWQESAAQALAKQDIKDGLDNRLQKQDWYGFHQEFY